MASQAGPDNSWLTWVGAVALPFITLWLKAIHEKFSRNKETLTLEMEADDNQIKVFKELRKIEEELKKEIGSKITNLKAENDKYEDIIRELKDFAFKKEDEIRDLTKQLRASEDKVALLSSRLAKLINYLKNPTDEPDIDYDNFNDIDDGGISY